MSWFMLWKTMDKDGNYTVNRADETGERSSEKAVAMKREQV